MLNKFYSYFFILCLFIGKPLFAEVKECSTMADVLTYATPSSLIFFNITDTIYQAQNTLGTAEWRAHFVEKVNENIKDSELCEEIIILVKNKTMLADRKKLVEVITPQIIQELQELEIPVFGCTTKHRTTPWISNFDEVVYNHLLSLGIDFEGTSHYLNIPSHLENMYRGIIFTEGLPQELALKNFIQCLDFFPQQVILIEDRLPSLLRIDNDLSAAGIKFMGLRYNYCDQSKSNFDADLGTIELLAFWNKNQEMTDEEALLEKQNSPGINYDQLLTDFIDRLANKRRSYESSSMKLGFELFLFNDDRVRIPNNSGNFANAKV